MLNKCMFIGRCGKDPEVRTMEGDRKLANLSLAVSDRYKDRSGEWREMTEWVSVVVFGATAEFIGNCVRQGALLYVEGKLRTRSYTDKSGQKKYVTEINAETVQLLDRKQEERPERPAPVREQRPAPRPVDDLPEDDNSLPF